MTPAKQPPPDTQDPNPTTARCVGGAGRWWCCASAAGGRDYNGLFDAWDASGTKARYSDKTTFATKTLLAQYISMMEMYRAQANENEDELDQVGQRGGGRRAREGWGPRVRGRARV